eukprot:XP_001692271.1 predicted protein [Chlamydomonas reinhardtii]
MQLPIASAPQLSSWCSVSNLVAIALAPRERPAGQEGGASTAAVGRVCQILIVEPSNPEDLTCLELPVTAHQTGSQQTVPYIKQEPGAAGAADATAVTTDGGAVADGAGASAGTTGAAAGGVNGPAFAGVCWLRQPQGGRTWSTSSLALKRLDPGPVGALGPGAAAFVSSAAAAAATAHGGGGGTQESLETVFYDDAPVGVTAAAAAAVPQAGEELLTPALLAAAKAVGGADAADADAAASSWRVASATMAATVDGGMLTAVVYAARREALYMFAMRGNPTLSGQPVTSGPGAPGATATSGATPAAAPPREGVQPVMALQAAVTMPPGLSAAQTRLHVPGGNGPRHAYVLATTSQPRHGLHSHQHHGQGNGNGPTGKPHEQVAGVVCFADATPPTSPAPPPGSGATASPPAIGGGGHWKLERQWMRQQTALPAGVDSDGIANGESSSNSAGSGKGSSRGQLLLSGDGSKLLAVAGRHVTALDAETLGVLSDVDLLADIDESQSQLAPGDAPMPNGFAGGSPPATEPSPSPASSFVVASTACLSGNACCLCTAALLRPLGVAAADAAGGDVADGMDLDGDPGDGGAEPAAATMALLVLRTLPDFVSPTQPHRGAANGGRAAHAQQQPPTQQHPGGPEEAMAVNMDTLRLAWGVLQRQSLWDVAERLRCSWLGGRRAGVAVALAQLDGLLYSVEDVILRCALAPGVSRAKLEVLRRLPHPRAGLVAADLLAAARLGQYVAALVLVWYVLEVATLMLSGIILWVEEMEAKMKEGYVDPVTGASMAPGEVPSAAAAAAAASSGDISGSADGWGGGWEAAGTGGGGGCDCLPLIRLFPDYNLHKTLQSVLLGYAPASGGKQATPLGLLQLAPMQELLGPDVAQRAKVVITVLNRLNQAAGKTMIAHVQAVQQQQQAQAQAQQPPGAAAPPPPAGLLPALADTPLTPTDMEAVKVGDLPKVVRAADMPNARSMVALSRDALLARYRLLGLQQQLEDPRSAPAGAARRLAMSFRAPAPPPELHSHVLTHHVSNRQRQRWRRQRGSALALGSSAPLWSHAQGEQLGWDPGARSVPVDCLTGAPLPPGSSWSLEGAAAGGAVTAQMGPGVAGVGVSRQKPSQTTLMEAGRWPQMHGKAARRRYCLLVASSVPAAAARQPPRQQRHQQRHQQRRQQRHQQRRQQQVGDR